MATSETTRGGPGAPPPAGLGEGFEATRLRTALAAGGLGWWEWDVAAGRVAWSPEVEAMHGCAAGTFPGTVDALAAAVHPDDRARVLAEAAAARDAATAAAAAGRPPAPFRIRYRFLRREAPADAGAVTPAYSTRWLDAQAAFEWGAEGGEDAAGGAAAGPPARLVGVARDVTEQVEADAAQAFLLDAAAALAGTLDVSAALADVARIAVPRVADWCAVDLLPGVLPDAGPNESPPAGGGGAWLRRVGVHHAAPEKVALAHELFVRYPPRPDDPGGVAAVVRTGEPELGADIPDALLETGARDARHLALLRGLGLRSYVTVPITAPALAAGGRVLGALTLVQAESGRRFGPRAVATADDLARRIALALGAARLYAEVRAANAQLQEQQAELETTAQQLEEQQVELELANQRLQEQTVELEAQAGELQAAAAQLEERTEAAEEIAAALRRSEQRYELAARATRNAIWDWDLATDGLAWNPGVAEVFGYRPEDVADTVAWWYDQIHPDDRDRVVTGIHRVIDDPAAGAVWAAEYRYRRGDGTYARVYDRGYVAREAGGRAVRMIGAMLDVTAEREALAAVDLERRRLDAALGALPVGVIIAEAPSGRLAYINPAFARIWGERHESASVEAYSAEWTGYHVAPGRPEDGRPYAAHEWPLARALRAGEAVAGERVDVSRADGTRVRLSLAAAPVRDADGAIVGGVVTAVDVTEGERLLEAVETERARLAGLFERAPAVMGIYSGPDHVITYVNPTWERTVGKPGAVGRPFREVFPEMAGTGLFERLAQCYASGEAYVDHELNVPLDRWRTGAAEDTYWDLVVQPLPGGGPLGRDLLVHAVEITTQVRARREVDRARAAAEAANASKSAFLANMSHELRTPLNAIGGYAELMELGLHGPVTDDQLSALARVRRAQQHLLGLINDVLNYAKLEAGRVEYDVRAVDLRDVVRDVAPLVEPQVAAQGLAFALELPDEPCPALADGEKLAQVLLNLLSNAVKFTPPGGRVTVSVPGRAERPGGAARVRVRDTGRGIPADKLEAVFEPFVQVGKRHPGDSPGTGLGLAISRDLARGMGGDLTAESVEGGGSTFTLTVPAA